MMVAVMVVVMVMVMVMMMVIVVRMTLSFQVTSDLNPQGPPAHVLPVLSWQMCARHLQRRPP